MLWYLLGVAMAAALLPEEAFAQSHEPARQPGFYFSITKLALLLLLFWLWVKTADWASVDAQTIGLEHAKWNLILVASFLLGLLVFGFLIPGPFWLFYVVNYPLVICCYAIPLTMYIRHRNDYVSVDERVMTPEHIRFVLATKAGMKIDKERKAPHEEGAPVVFNAQGADDEMKNQANIIVARQSPGYLTAKELFADAIDKRAERVMLDYTRDGAHVRYMVDGVWHNVDPRDRESADVMLAVFKKMANLNEKERRAKQEGSVKAEYQDAKYNVSFVSQGVKTGERVLLGITNPKGKKYKTLDELGMREKMQERLKEVIGGKQGLFLFSSPPGGGLTTTMGVSLSATDRLLRDFLALEEVNRRELEVENIDVMTYDSSAGEDPLKTLQVLMRKEPDAVVLPELPSGEVVSFMCEQVLHEEKLFLSTVRAKDAVEALLRVLALKPRPQEFANSVLGVLNTRMIRKLCKKCKEPYEPSPQLLKKLGIPPGRVTELWQERQPPGPEATDKERKEKETPCEICRGVGYRGRTAIFELLIVNDQLREGLVKSPNLEALRKVARATGHRGLQEEGIAVVVQGITSLVELQRVLKQ